MPRASTETKTKAATKRASSKSKDDKPKAKRAPSAYNLFMQANLKKWREENPGKPVKEGMAAVAAWWRESPENPNRGKAPAAKPAPKTKAKAKKPAKSEEEEDDDDEADD